jgi:hypothetical protein
MKREAKPAANRVDEIEACVHTFILNILAVYARLVIEVGEKGVVNVLDYRVPSTWEKMVMRLDIHASTP